VTFPRLVPSFAFLVLTTTFLAAPAGAQSCGDADGSGSVTVTDGVQTLRSAAGLSSSCTPARCDVDGSGSISVTDGVNVLRKAAGLAAPSACPGGGGDGVQAAVDTVLPFLAFGLQFASDVSLAAPAGSDDSDPCPDGGARTKGFISPGLLRVSFNACRYSSPGLGRFEFAQGLIINFLRAQVALNVKVTDLDGGQTVNFEGSFDFVPRDGGGFIGNGQDILLTTPQGDFTFDLDNLTVDDEGHVIAGGGSVEDTSDNFDLQRIDFQVTGPGSGSLTATFDDATTKSYTLNLITGDLTEV
jgi:hypothetical protein